MKKISNANSLEALKEEQGVLPADTDEPCDFNQEFIELLPVLKLRRNTYFLASKCTGTADVIEGGKCLLEIPADLLEHIQLQSLSNELEEALNENTMEDIKVYFRVKPVPSISKEDQRVAMPGPDDLIIM